MKTLACLISLAAFAHSAYAFNIEEEFKKATQAPSKFLQKSQIVKVGPRVFNHDGPEEARPKAGEFWIGVVGDSSTTGAAANPAMEAKWLSLLGTIGDAIADLKSPGENSDLPSPLRVMYSQEEFDQADHEGEALELNVQSDLSQKLDTEQFSFGYALARQWPLAPEKLVLTGQDSTRISSMGTQFKRLLTVGTGALPPLVLVSYVANDICHPANFEQPVAAFQDSYSKELRAQLEQVAALPADQNGTRIVFMAPLDISNVLTNPDLMAQQVPFEGGKTVACGDLRTDKSGNGDFEKAMRDTLIGECRGVLSQGGDPAAKIARVKELQEVQWATIQALVTEFNARGLPLKAEYAASTKSIAFKNGDLANDCFHPSQKGAEQIANTLLNNELKH